jgi:hypothetical protein
MSLGSTRQKTTGGARIPFRAPVRTSREIARRAYKGLTPPVNGFWSLTLYNEHHFFAPNTLNRYSLGTKNKGLQYNADGSLTLYVQAGSPGSDKESNGLPAPKDGDFSLYVRTYWPKVEATDGSWTPPPVQKTN